MKIKKLSAKTYQSKLADEINPSVSFEYEIGNSFRVEKDKSYQFESKKNQAVPTSNKSHMLVVSNKSFKKLEALEEEDFEIENIILLEDNKCQFENKRLNKEHIRLNGVSPQWDEHFINCGHQSSGLYNTVIKIDEKDAEQLIRIKRKYKVKQFYRSFKKIDSLFKNNNNVIEQEFRDKKGKKKKIYVIEKGYWKRKLWRDVDDLYINPPAIQSALFLFMGTGKTKTGFLELLNNRYSIYELKKKYGKHIYLFTYPTVFESVNQNVDKINNLITINNLDKFKQVDVIGTSRGCLVVKELLLTYSKQDYFNKAIFVNGPNLGTPSAMIPNINHMLFGFSIAIFQKFSYDILKGIENMIPKSQYLKKLNKRYNNAAYLDKRNHFYIGTENRLKGELFKNFPNDRIIPVSSMIGERSPEAYGYDGVELEISTMNKNIISKSAGGRKHGKQFRNLLLLEWILNILKDKSDPLKKGA